MKIGIIGQGAGALFLSLLLKSKNESLDITIIDQNINPFRKLYATGNGRCNLANKVISRNSYNSEPAFKLTREYNYIDMIKFLKSLGIYTRLLDDLVYPYSLSAKAFTDYCVSLLKQYKVKFINKEKVLDYLNKDKSISVNTKGKEYIFDKVIFATGAKSHKVFGSDGSFLDVLKKHNYKIKSLKPGLVPLKVKENVKQVENERLKVGLTLIIDSDVAYKEQGEVLFKKDGLSGICVFNASSIIARDPGFKEATIKLDLFPEIPNETLLKQFTKDNKVSRDNFLNGYFTQNMAEYIRKLSGCKNLKAFDSYDLKRIVKCVKEMSFIYASPYSFDDSQVSVGGIELNSIDDNFMSKKEKNVFFIGEVLNLDGLCGGYNLMLCYAEARKISEYLLTLKD